MCNQPDLSAASSGAALVQLVRACEGLSVRGLAELLGLTRGALYHWSSGRHVPTAEHVSAAWAAVYERVELVPIIPTRAGYYTCNAVGFAHVTGGQLVVVEVNAELEPTCAHVGSWPFGWSLDELADWLERERGWRLLLPGTPFATCARIYNYCDVRRGLL